MFVADAGVAQGIRLGFGLIFAGLGIWFVVWPWSIAAVFPFFRQMFLPSDVRDRVTIAAIARREAEGVSSRLGVFPGFAMLILTVLTFATHLPIAALYSMEALTVALTIGVAFVQVRTRVPRRAARLAPRDAFGPVAAWVYAVALVGISLPVLYADGAVVKAFIVGSGLVILGLAWSAAQAPAVLVGSDAVAEEFVDTRLRRFRAAYLVQMSMMPAFGASMLAIPQTDVRLLALRFAVLAIYLMLASIASRATTEKLTLDEYYALRAHV